MTESGFASLGPSLLARKGGAKPAMRPQVAPLVADEAELTRLADDKLEDLGWNDMGDDLSGGGAEIVPINAEVAADDFAAPGPGPIVRRQQRRLEERVLADAAMTGPEDCEPEYGDEEDLDYGVSFEGQEEVEGLEAEDEAQGDYASLAPQPAAAPVRGAVHQPAATPRRARVIAAQVGRRAAFTLRLDADRHLKLRLAATMHGVSAQTLVTEALDRMLAEYDELDVIATHLKRH